MKSILFIFTAVVMVSGCDSYHHSPRTPMSIYGTWQRDEVVPTAAGDPLWVKRHILTFYEDGKMSHEVLYNPSAYAANLKPENIRRAGKFTITETVIQVNIESESFIIKHNSNDNELVIHNELNDIVYTRR